MGQFYCFYGLFIKKNTILCPIGRKMSQGVKYMNFLTFMVFASLIGLSGNCGAQSGKAKAISRSYGRVGTLFDLSLYYGQSEATANPAPGNSWTNTTAIYDIRAGYIAESGVYFGGLYTSRSDNQVSLNTETGSSTGVGAGYFADNGFFLRGYYKFGDTFGNYSDGTGFQADLGYLLNPTSSFFFGVNLSIRQTQYKSNPTIAGFDSWTRKETYPFLTFGFLFN